MAELIGLPSHYKANLRFSRGSVVAGCTLYFVSPGVDPDPDDFGTFASDVAAAVETAILPCIEPTTSFDGVDLTYKSSDLDLQGASSAGPQSGTAAAGDILPEEDAVVLQRRTGQPGRNSRGRIFLPFIPEAFALDSKLTAAAITKYQAVAAALMVPVASGPEGGVILQPRHYNKKAGVFQPIVAWRVVDNTCSRRDRRAPKRYRAIGVG